MSDSECLTESDLIMICTYTIHGTIASTRTHSPCGHILFSSPVTIVTGVADITVKCKHGNVRVDLDHGVIVATFSDGSRVTKGDSRFNVHSAIDEALRLAGFEPWATN